MKIFKIFISTLFGVILATIGLTTFSAYADNTPTISTRLEHIDNSHVKATIQMSDFPPISSGAFHIELGNGFVFDTDYDFGGIAKYNCQGTTSALVGNVYFNGSAGGSSAFVMFIDPDVENEDINGDFLEVFLIRTQNFSNFDSTFNVLLLSNEYAEDYFANASVSVNYHAEDINVPYMYKSARYLLGDVDGNGVVNNADATAIDTVLAQYPYSYNISDIEGTYYYLFPYADDAWALDANQNGTLTNSDSTAILQYVAQGSNYTGNIGEIFYHCYYTTYYL